MPSGVKIKDVEVGTGDEATRGKTVWANVHIFLNHGTEITMMFTGSPRMRIDLGKRESIAGLRYGIEGMRVGGRRTLIISPHLAYGVEGAPGIVPSNAVLRCEVELLDVREAGVIKPEDYPPGRHLCVFHPGEAARNLPRWQFGLNESGRCSLMIAHPIPGLTWRHTRRRHQQAELDSTTIDALFEQALAFPMSYPEECLKHSELWADHAERGNGITRKLNDDSLCITIGVMQASQWLCYYAVAETSRTWLASQLFHVISGLLGERGEERNPEA